MIATDQEALETFRSMLSDWNAAGEEVRAAMLARAAEQRAIAEECDHGVASDCPHYS